jgi:hypothetical protein
MYRIVYLLRGANAVIWEDGYMRALQLAQRLRVQGRLIEFRCISK